MFYNNILSALGLLMISKIYVNILVSLYGVGPLSEVHSPLVEKLKSIQNIEILLTSLSL